MNGNGQGNGKNKLRKAFIGFDELFDEMHRQLGDSRFNNGNYPPYSIIKMGEDHYMISIAVAGFTRDEIDIEQKNNVLNVTGKNSNQDENYEYLYKGLAQRDFTRTFTLADEVDIISAELENGILNIKLLRNKKKNTKSIPIE